MLFALGVGDSVVAVTHECDHPVEAARLPHATRSVIPEGLSAAEIDRAVRERTRRGEALYELDVDVLDRLQPDLIVTQAVCEVCAVSYEDVRAVADRLRSHPRVVSQDPSTLGEVLASIRSLGRAAHAEEAAGRLLEDAADRLDRVKDAVARSVAAADGPGGTDRGKESGAMAVADVDGPRPRRPRVAALEWLDPPFVGGHWVPQMIELAGGEDVLGLAGEKSRTVEWAELERSRPDVVVAMPCGYGLERSAQEALSHGEPLARLGARTVVAVDAAAFFSRPGPRLVDGVELLAHLLHPNHIEPAPEGRAMSLHVATATA